MIKALISIASIAVGAAVLGVVAYGQAHSPHSKGASRISLPLDATNRLGSETPKAILDALDSDARVQIVLVNPVFIVGGPAPRQEAAPPAARQEAAPDASPTQPSVGPEAKRQVPGIIVQ